MDLQLTQLTRMKLSLISLATLAALNATAQTTTTTTEPTDSIDDIELSVDLKDVEITAQRQLIKTEIDRVSYDVQADAESKTRTAMDMLRKVPLVTRRHGIPHLQERTPRPQHLTKPQTGAQGHTGQHDQAHRGHH